MPVSAVPVSLVPESATAVSATLEKYEPVLLPGGGAGAPRVALRIVASTMTAKPDKAGRPQELRVRLNLGEPEVSSERPRPVVFDLQTLLRVYKISDVVRLDQD